MAGGAPLSLEQRPSAADPYARRTRVASDPAARAGSPGAGGFVVPSSRPFIAACMLAHNDAATIARAIGSVRPHVDEVVVYHTGGCGDDTLGVLAAVASGPPGAPVRVYRAGEELRSALYADGGIADLAAARNISFALAAPAAEWLLWLDPDDVIDCGRDLHELAAAAPRRIDAFYCAYETAFDGEGRCIDAHWRERLVRRGRLRWQRPVHEVLVPPESLASRHDHRDRWRKLAAGELRVVHLPIPAADRNGWKLRILREMARQAEAVGLEADARTLWHLGAGVKAHDPDEALAYFVRSALALDSTDSARSLCDIASFLRDVAVREPRTPAFFWLALLLDGIAAQLWDEPPAIVGAAESNAALGRYERAAALLEYAEKRLGSDPEQLGSLWLDLPPRLVQLRAALEACARTRGDSRPGDKETTR